MEALGSPWVRIAHFLGIDKGTFFAISGKMWGMGAGFVTTLFIAAWFTSELQGYYYTFISVLALQVFAEMGLGGVIGSYASHEWAKLSFGKNGELQGDAEALSRLNSLGRFALKWYVAAGVLLAVALVFGGFIFFASTGWEKVSVWGGPWLVLCILTGINLFFIPVWALLEGCNQVESIYFYRFIQAVMSSVVTWAGIYMGAGLWTCALVAAVLLLVTLLTVVRRYRSFIRQVMFALPLGGRLNWRTDILPMQWRVSLSWMSGYLTFFLFTPVLFYYQGATAAGQMGMTWTFIAALSSVVSSWVIPKAPLFGVLIARHQYAALDAEFWRVTKIVVGISVLGAAVIWGGICVLNVMGHPLAGRLLAPSTAAYFLAATLLQVIALPMSVYLRAHKKEPLLFVSLASGLATSVAVLVLGKFYSVEGVAIGYMAVAIVVMPFVAVIWQRCRTAWHGMPSPANP